MQPPSKEEQVGSTAMRRGARTDLDGDLKGEGGRDGTQKVGTAEGPSLIQWPLVMTASHIHGPFDTRIPPACPYPAAPLEACQENASPQPWSFNATPSENF